MRRKNKFDLGTVREIEGHSCNLQKEEDILVTYINDGLFVEWRRKFRKWMMVSPIHPKSTLIFKSTTQLRLEESRHLTKYYYMIHPFSEFNRYKQYAAAICYIIYLFVMPVEILVYRTPLALVMFRFYVDIPALFIYFLFFLTGFYDKKTNRVKMYWKDVGKNYLQTHFFFDVTSSIPISWILWVLDIEEYGFLKVIFVLKLLRLQSFMRVVKATAKRYRSLATHSHLIVLGLYILVALAWTSSLVILFRGLLYRVEEQIEDEDEIEDLFDFDEIGESGFKTVLSILLIRELNAAQDHGIIYPILRILCLTVGAIMNVMLFTNIMQMYTKHSISENKYHRIMSELSEYMRYKEIPVSTQKKIWHYIDVKYKKNIFSQADLQMSLSSKINDELLIHDLGPLLRPVEFLQDVPEQILLDIIKKLRFEIYFQNETIVTAGLVANAMYFLYNGAVAVYTRKNTEVCHLQDGAHFGELALIVDEPRPMTIKTISDCKVFKLTRKDFNEAIELYPEMMKIIKASALMKISMMKQRFNEM